MMLQVPQEIDSSLHFQGLDKNGETKHDIDLGYYYLS